MSNEKVENDIFSMFIWIALRFDKEKEKKENFEIIDLDESLKKSKKIIIFELKSNLSSENSLFEIILMEKIYYFKLLNLEVIPFFEENFVYKQVWEETL